VRCSNKGLTIILSVPVERAATVKCVQCSCSEAPTVLDARHLFERSLQNQTCESISFLGRSINLGLRASYRYDSMDLLLMKHRETLLIKSLTGEPSGTRSPTEPGIEINPIKESEKFTRNGGGSFREGSHLRCGGGVGWVGGHLRQTKATRRSQCW
jgi:hypothetical protein